VRKTAYNELEIDEIEETSAVDNPAQVGARAVIFKRALANTDSLPVGSKAVATTQENQNVTKVEDAPAIESVQKQLKAAQDELAAAKAEAAIQKSIAELSDAERAHYRGLDETGRGSFLKLSTIERAEKVRAASEANPVVYTSPISGEAFRKSDDPRLVAMAKRADEQSQALALEKAAREDEQFAKRADAELKNMPGDQKVKVELLKVVEGIKDQPTRDGAKALLKAGNDALSKAFETRGTTSGGDGKSAHEKLEGIAKSLRVQNPKLSEFEAYDLAGSQNPDLKQEAIREG
jgi:hypothetical protein